MALAMTLRALLVIFIVLIGFAQGGKILFFFPFASKSIKICFYPLAKELVKRGHQVTVVMPFEAKESDPNLEIITIESQLDELLTNVSRKVLREPSGSKMDVPFDKLINVAASASDSALSHPRLKEYLRKNTKFDVSIVSPFVANEAGYYVAHRFQSTLVLFFTGQASIPTLNWAFGQPHNPAYVPLILFDFKAPMSFLQRFMNTYATLAFHYIGRNWYILSKVNAILDKHFPNVERPDILELETNASLGLAFGHQFLLDGNRPVSPGFQYIGMMNCRPAEPLPEDLKDFIDGSGEEGVIYVSFGSVLQASEMSDSTRLILVNVFKKLKQRIIWKWETEQMPDLPANVKLSKWLPQQDILAHPKTRLFITHGGQSSTQEALCHKKPTVVVSVAGDQHSNGQDSEHSGTSVWLPYYQLTEEKLDQAVGKVLQDPKYTEKAQEFGSLLTDVPIEPMDKAVFWIEFLLRHPGKNYFRSPVHDLSWYQFFLLDVIALSILIAFILAYIVYNLFVCCCRRKQTAQISSRNPSKKTN